ncbi:hypothetical protein ABIE41_001463 [Bosea sp. OAE506]|uniref:hypothetical protein n=1 Tax=Bosea sp. OAE506 TaxID=2663870 RepID=UPI00178A13D3
MTQLQFIDGILQPSRIADALPRMTVAQLAACASASRTLGQLAIDMLAAPEFGGFCEAGQTPAGEWLEGMALAMIEGGDRCIAELRERRPATNDERDAQASALIGHAVQSNEPVTVVAALAISLASKRH